MKGFFIALQFLTRIKPLKNIAVTEEDLSLSTYYFPVVGLLLGGIIYLIALAAISIFQPLTLAILIFTVEIVITGGLHLDGFMDTCDGILSIRERDKALEIMKDSRVGAMGVIGLLLLSMVKVVFLYELILKKEYLALLILMPFLGRWAMTYVLIYYSSARKNGLGQMFKNKVSSKSFLVISFYSLLIIAPFFYYWFLVLALGWLSTALLVYLTTRRINMILGGHTGDTYGAINELAEIYYLCNCVLLINILSQT